MADRAAGGSARPAVIPRATYRIQLNSDFTFRDARALVPYLAALGISHVYCSPYFRARPGSRHGYDVVDHNSLNPEIGTREDFDAFVAELRAHGMGHILDFVPNHVGIMGADNAYWMDVLEQGRDSRYAEFFDIDWSPPNPTLEGKLLVPALGDPYGTVLERGELKLRFEPESKSLAVWYFQHRFPIDPRTCPPDIAACMKELPAAQSEIESAVKELNGEPGNPQSFDTLHELLEKQAYRLAYWRVASDDINYRRFFDVNDLAALRMERDDVFDVTHRLALELIREGKLDGLRIDHPDGLYDPVRYFTKLQGEAQRAASTPQPIYLLVEKITASFERLPLSWPVHGTTGYDFANVVNGLFVESRAKSRLDRIYRAFIVDYTEWADTVHYSKVLILRTSLGAELNVLANQLARIAQADRHTRDFTLTNLRQALTDVIAAFPVYRTYVTDSASEEDRRYIDWAIARARSRSSSTNSPMLDFVRSMLLAETAAVAEPVHEQVRAFARKFQQVTAPVTAKGVEDTALYRFTRLASLNEVGGEPENFGTSISQFHADARHRSKHWPHEMLATSTHDTKRSEDVRARMNVISEIPGLWRAAIQRWSRMNRIRRRLVDDLPAPGPHAEYLLYQTLLGTWPLEPLGDEAHAAYRERIEEYMVKAMREAKRRTSWANVNEDYENALRNFIRLSLERREGNHFPGEVEELARRIAPVGFLNSLGQTLCKLTAPGMPDIYQGNELWDGSLVDPDNRRPVDYSLRREYLEQVNRESSDVPEVLRRWLATLHDGRAKLYVTWRALQFRRDNENLFREGSYLPLKVSGPYATHVVAYARRLRDQMAIMAFPRLCMRLLGGRAALPLGNEVWRDTRIELPRKHAVVAFRNILAGGDVSATINEADRTAHVAVADLLRDFPVALAATASDTRAPGA